MRTATLLGITELRRQETMIFVPQEGAHSFDLAVSTAVPPSSTLLSPAVIFAGDGRVKQVFGRRRHLRSALGPHLLVFFLFFLFSFFSTSTAATSSSITAANKSLISIFMAAPHDKWRRERERSRGRSLSPFIAHRSSFHPQLFSQSLRRSVFSESSLLVPLPLPLSPPSPPHRLHRV